jgi:hypothetical protein
VLDSRGDPDRLGFPWFVVWPILLEPILTPMEEELSIAMNCRASGGQTVSIGDIYQYWAENMQGRAFGGVDRGVLTGDCLALW